MSFSTEVKNELCRVSMQRACCTRAEVYGALLHASVFSHKEIRLSAENMTVVRRLQALLQRAFFVECEPQKAGRKQQLVLTEPAQIGRVFDALGYDCKSHITYHINRNLLEEDCCIASFLRGAFLMGGTVAGPDKKSHLELKTTHQSLSGEETSLMLDLGLSPKQARRGSAYLLYFKDGASAEDFLTRIGAPHAAMELMQAKVEKNLRNTINRQVNCETANMMKAADASAAFIMFAVSQLTCRLIVLRRFFSTFACISSIAACGAPMRVRKSSALAPSLKYSRYALPRRACLGDKPKSSIRLVSSPDRLWWVVFSSRWLFLSGPATVPPMRKAPRRKDAMQQSSSSRLRLM